MDRDLLLDDIRCYANIWGWAVRVGNRESAAYWRASMVLACAALRAGRIYHDETPQDEWFKDHTI